MTDFQGIETFIDCRVALADGVITVEDGKGEFEVEFAAPDDMHRFEVQYNTCGPDDLPKQERTHVHLRAVCVGCGWVSADMVAPDHVLLLAASIAVTMQRIERHLKSCRTGMN